MNILVVDDNEQNLYQLQVLLGGNGYQVVTAVNGADALTKARQNPPDLVISDILMPVMDGFALCREWKDDKQLSPIPFIFYTATYTDGRDRDFALSLGAERFLVKPEEPETFIKTIKEVIRQVQSSPAVLHKPPQEEENSYLMQYNQVLIHKLETKMQQLEQTNRDLEQELAERKQAEAMLQREQDLYKDLVNTLPAGVYRLRIRPGGEWNANSWRSQFESYCSVDMVSDRFCQITGISRKEFEAHPVTVFDRVHPDDSPGFIRKNMEAAASMVFFSWEGHLVVAEGVIIWVHFESIPRRLENGEVIWTGIVYDITARKRAEEALRESKETLNSIFRSAPVGICIMKNRVYQSANTFWCEGFGYQEKNLIGKTTRMLYESDEEYDRVGQELYSNLQSGNIASTEARLRGGDGIFHNVVLTAALLRAGDPSSGTVVSIHDVTARKKAEAEVRQLNAELEKRVIERTAQLEVANRELEAFSYSVSHDLRAPLRAVDGYTHILLEDYGSRLDDEGKRLCSVISESARNMGKLIDDLLAFSRIGRAAMQSSIIDMATMANSIFFELTTPEDRKRIDFHVSPLPSIVGDSTLIRQVWRNLLGNAVKFSFKKERAMVEINAEQHGDEVVYSVRDNGAGFDMQYVDKLFGVFQRLHSIKEFEGTGVGLAVVQRIIHRHGGRVWAESEPDKGATFYFTMKK